MIKKTTSLFFAVLTTSLFANAICEITVTRTPCPGTKIRAEALGPYSMKEEFPVKKVEGKTLAECKAETVLQGTIKRKGLFLKKVAIGKFDGAVVETKEDAAEASSCNPEPK
ncbi:MAG: hypothetical protein WA160_15780 [Pseudobdellovibrio sp.]